ncbi:Protein of unknown function [Anaplasma phagocytophilum]|uniref:Uncharacterized protein n=1 Tax=Anaplasma phagocytophilum TaxID=948 RepID=A0A098GL27_ANAPH|nr:Protein of unknown function [Anaplasma phagocytophilum]
MARVAQSVFDHEYPRQVTRQVLHHLRNVLQSAILHT